MRLPDDLYPSNSLPWMGKRSLNLITHTQKSQCSFDEGRVRWHLREEREYHLKSRGALLCHIGSHTLKKK